MIQFCTADEIAIAICAAAKIEGEDPLNVAQGGVPSHARYYAAAALFDVFPNFDFRAIGRGVGVMTHSSTGNLRSTIRYYRTGKGPKWFDAKVVSRVIRELKRASHTADQSVALDIPKFLKGPEDGRQEDRSDLDILPKRDADLANSEPAQDQPLTRPLGDRRVEASREETAGRAQAGAVASAPEVPAQHRRPVEFIPPVAPRVVAPLPKLAGVPDRLPVPRKGVRRVLTPTEEAHNRAFFGDPGAVSFREALGERSKDVV